MMSSEGLAERLREWTGNPVFEPGLIDDLVFGLALDPDALAGLNELVASERAEIEANHRDEEEE